MSKKLQQLDKDHFSELKNVDTSKSQKKLMKKTSDCHGYTEKSKKMVFIYLKSVYYSQYSGLVISRDRIYM
jgi:hypothetical protein